MLGSMRPTTLSRGPSLCSKRKEWLQEGDISSGPHSHQRLDLLPGSFITTEHDVLAGPSVAVKSRVLPLTYSCSNHQDVKVGTWRWRSSTVSGIVSDQRFGGLRELSSERGCFVDNMLRGGCHGGLTGCKREERSRVGKSGRFRCRRSDRR
jgi:hypothetical protein